MNVANIVMIKENQLQVEILGADLCHISHKDECYWKWDSSFVKVLLKVGSLANKGLNRF